MEATWQVQEAKNRFSEMIERAQSEGPQIITRHGRVVAKVVAADVGQGDAHGATAADGFASYLLTAPRVEGLQLPLRRSRKSPVRLGD
ncbi:MAG: type II toxin-antitoxin system prevent-host-death family antitoxin [Rhodoferax sp.]|nr:type II toxin-antitoxin system prevent-host-death family antitoxin [Rhodoferax sp.]